MKKDFGKGFFITFEGVEGAGKTTQVKLLRDFLLAKGYEVVLTREPGGTPLGEKIRKILASLESKDMTPLTEFLLFSASRAQHVVDIIKPALKKGQIVICDRFADASVAYQGYGRKVKLSVVNQINSIATSGIKPDLTFFLDLDPQKGLKRVIKRIKKTSSKRDRFEIEDKSFFTRVRKGYLALGKREPNRVKVLKADLSSKTLHRKIANIVLSKLKSQKLVAED